MRAGSNNRLASPGPPQMDQSPPGSPIPSSLTPGYNGGGGASNRTTQWPSPVPSPVPSRAGSRSPLARSSIAYPDARDRSVRSPSPPPMSPGYQDGSDIPIALSPGPERLSTMSSLQPPAAPIAGSARTRTQKQQKQPRGRFLEVEPESTQHTPMPFMPEPSSPPPPKLSRVRELRASLKPSRRLPQPLPSPSIYNGSDGQPETPPPMPTNMDMKLDVERATETKRKTFFQRALEGWWEVPGLLRSDTVKSKLRGSPSSRKAPAGFI